MNMLKRIYLEKCSCLEVFLFLFEVNVSLRDIFYKWFYCLLSMVKTQIEWLHETLYTSISYIVSFNIPSGVHLFILCCT